MRKRGRESEFVTMMKLWSLICFLGKLSLTGNVFISDFDPGLILSVLRVINSYGISISALVVRQKLNIHSRVEANVSWFRSESCIKVAKDA